MNFKGIVAWEIGIEDQLFTIHWMVSHSRQHVADSLLTVLKFLQTYPIYSSKVALMTLDGVEPASSRISWNLTSHKPYVVREILIFYKSTPHVLRASYHPFKQKITLHSCHTITQIQIRRRSKGKENEIKLLVATIKVPYLFGIYLINQFFMFRLSS
jgi:hypothetical protein